MENLLKAYQAAQVLGVSESKLNQLVREGAIAYVKIGNRNRRYRQEDLKAFQDSRLMGVTK